MPFLEFFYFYIYLISLKFKILDKNANFFKIAQIPYFSKIQKLRSMALIYNFILEEKTEILKMFCFYRKLGCCPSSSGILAQVHAAAGLRRKMLTNLTK